MRILKTRAATNAINKIKVETGASDLESILLDSSMLFENENGDGSVSSDSHLETRMWSYVSIVKWFVSHYDVVRNLEFDPSEKGRSFTALQFQPSSSDVKLGFIRTARLKIQQKDNEEVDFMELSYFEPYESFVFLQKVILEHYMEQ